MQATAPDGHTVASHLDPVRILPHVMKPAPSDLAAGPRWCSPALTQFLKPDPNTPQPVEKLPQDRFQGPSEPRSAPFGGENLVKSKHSNWDQACTDSPLRVFQQAARLSEPLFFWSRRCLALPDAPVNESTRMGAARIKALGVVPTRPDGSSHARLGPRPRWYLPGTSP